MRNVIISSLLALSLPISALAQTPNCDPAKDPLCNLSGPINAIGPMSVSITPHPSWKNALEFNDAFLKEELVFDPLLGATGTKWAKLTILTEDPSVVYFQDSNDYAFHYDFATERLDPFVGMTRPDYDEVSLHPGPTQKAILGAVIRPFDPRTAEVGIQLVGQEAYDRDAALAALQTIQAGLDLPAGTTLFYFPTYEQKAAAEAETDFFETAGFPVSSSARWTPGDVCYASGWNVGRLTYVAPADIDAAYAAGTLLPTDILLTDGVPADVPFVAGIITLTPSTPNSHVAILSESYGIPFVYPRDPAEATRLKSLAGKTVSLSSGGGLSGCNVGVFDLSTVDPVSIGELLALKTPAPVDITPKAPLGQIAIDVSALGNNAVGVVGGKAANYKLLREALPNNTRPATAFSFDLFDAFMDQDMGGTTLRATINARLANLTYPGDIGEITQALGDIREMITDDASFTPTQQTDIFAALSGFDADQKIKFRSSTNVEDGDTFVGAGLYGSSAGCLSDDTDGNTTGPSHCDSDRATERGVLRAIQRVYASFYNDNAYLERLRRGVDESVVGMGMLAHHSFLDATELANGVVTYEVPENRDPTIRVVSQPGAASVANPDGDAGDPEIVEITESQWAGTQIRKVQQASRLQLGATALEWQTEYQTLANLLRTATTQFVNARGLSAPYKLDFEYKKVEGEGLVLKQIRPVPQATGDGNVNAFLVGAEVELCTFQGEYSNVFANHQLKSRVTLTARNTWLSGTIGESLYTAGELQFVKDGQVTTLSGAPSSWPDAAFATGPGNNTRMHQTSDAWKTTGSSNEWVSTMTSEFAKQRFEAHGPLTTPDGFVVYQEATFTIPVPTPDWSGSLGTTTSQTVRLVPCPDKRDPVAGESVRTREVTAGSVNVETSYVHPPGPRGITAGYTAPLVRWVGTTITGLTSTPIELTGFFSQTYRPGHHNFSAAFLFEPGLEEGLDAGLRAELEAADIVQIYVNHRDEIFTIDSAGVVTQR